MDFLPDSTYTVLNDSQSLPSNYLLPLKTWFSAEALQHGHTILRNKEVFFFSFHRRFAGILFKDSSSVTLQMGKKKGKLPFVLRDGHCSICGWQVGGGNCEHVAALALLCTRHQDGAIHSLADLFSDSVWLSIGRYFHEQTGMGRAVKMDLQSHGDSFVLRGRSDNGLSLEISMSDKAVAELACFFPGICKSCVVLEEKEHERSRLQEELLEKSVTPGERKLQAAGMQSKKQNLESSLWFFLAQLLFLRAPAEHLQVQQSADGIYTLHYTRSGNTIYSLCLPKEHTWELLNTLSLPGIPERIERAEQFSRVSFCENSGDIEVQHCCRLPDGTEYRLADIAQYSYGNRYQVDTVVFSLNTIPGDEQLRENQVKQLSLFADIGEKSKDSRYSFVVAEKNVLSFIEKNHAILHCGRHQVADDILNMKVVSLPEKLIVTDYEEDGDWCYLAGWYGMGSHNVSLDDLLEAADAGKSVLPGKTWIDLKDSPLSWFYEAGADHYAAEGDRIRMSRGEFLVLSSQIGSVSSHGGETDSTLVEFLQSDKKSPSLKTAPAEHLRSYQRHGCNWLYQLQYHHLGGILADDMGLGKTHQALGLIDLLADGKSRFLIVCPAAVLYHWPEKQKAFFPQLSLVVHHGVGRDLENALKSRIIVTSYGVMRQDVDCLGEHRFKLLLFDEMHTLKNKKTATHAAAGRLQADTVIGLTGTPIENNVQELETLLGLCLPGIFTASFIRQQFKGADSREQRQYLQKLVAPFILRRTRNQVLVELPECSEDIRVCERSDDQVAAYREVAEQAADTVDEYLDPDQQSNYTTILAAITHLKQICNHLSQLEKCDDYKQYESGKWDEFTSLVSQCLESGHKVVVFSQFTAMLDLIEAWVRDNEIGFVDLRGSVAAKERSRRIKQFNGDGEYKVCCASLLAGGTGIDLTGAQVVIHYDRWWNPAKEEQATARVHRMGQTQPVQVYKLITAGTLEEKIHTMIERKRNLATDLIAEDDGSVLKTLSRQELARLFQLT